MNKEAKWISFLLAVVIAGLAGCAHKPAYSEMDANRALRNQNQNQSADGQATATPPAATEAPATEAAQPAPAAPPAPFKPSFLDQSTSGIRDLPAYPNSYRVSAQLGPMQGLNTMSLGFTTTDPMDKITAFFERAIKDNKWTVVDKIIDQEFSEWTLKKGEDHNAKVQVKKDERSTAFGIVMVRSEKIGAPSK